MTTSFLALKDRRQSLLHSVPISSFLKDECFCAAQEVWLEQQDKSLSPPMTSWNRNAILLDHLFVTRKRSFSFVQSLCCMCLHLYANKYTHFLLTYRSWKQ